ncbi:MAG TPA: hypothetical protein DCQ98_02000 [Planctomycetaceae bacterium]|nr:hypothetical protein [Planctomycetaceae bacterium]HRF00518.1 hypothetical protein [Pirellulaceae bacterium]
MVIPLVTPESDSQESLDDLLACVLATGHALESSSRIGETLRVRTGGGGSGDSIGWSGEVLEAIPSGVRALFDRTMIVGDVYRIERHSSDRDECRLVRCTACRLREGERFEAELRYFGIG